MQTTIAAIEDAIAGRISQAALPYLRTVGTYGGQLDGVASHIVQALPAIWVAFQGAGQPAPAGTSHDVWHVPATWVVLAVSRSLRGEAAGRKGDGATPGTYQMLHDVTALLLGQDFEDQGLEMSPLRPGRVRSLFNGRLQSSAISVYSQEWHTRYALRAPLQPLAPDGEGTPPHDLCGIDLRYHLHPDDGRADASDSVTFQQE
jgi:phage gp37-like protein